MEEDWELVPRQDDSIGHFVDVEREPSLYQVLNWVAAAHSSKKTVHSIRSPPAARQAPPPAAASPRNEEVPAENSFVPVSKTRNRRHRTGHTMRKRCSFYSRQSTLISRSAMRVVWFGKGAISHEMSAFDVARPELSSATEFSLSKHPMALAGLYAHAATVSVDGPSLQHYAFPHMTYRFNVPLAGHVVARATAKAKQLRLRRHGVYQVKGPTKLPKLLFIPSDVPPPEIPRASRQLFGRLSAQRGVKPSRGTRLHKAWVRSKSHKSIFSVHSSGLSKDSVTRRASLTVDLRASCLVTHVSTQGRHPRTFAWPPRTRADAALCGLEWPLPKDCAAAAAGRSASVQCVSPDECAEYVTKFELQVRSDGGKAWRTLGTFNGNSDSHTEHAHVLENGAGVVCRYLRFVPFSFVGRCCSTRVGVYGGCAGASKKEASHRRRQSTAALPEGGAKEDRFVEFVLKEPLAGSTSSGELAWHRSKSPFTVPKSQQRHTGRDVWQSLGSRKWRGRNNRRRTLVRSARHGAEHAMELSTTKLLQCTPR